MDTRETALLLFVEMEKTKNFGSSLIRDTLNKYDYEDPRETADPQSAAPVGLSNFVYGHRAGFCGMQRSRASGKEKGL